MSESVGAMLRDHHADETTPELATTMAILRIADGLAHEERIGFTCHHEPEAQVKTADVTLLGLQDRWTDLVVSLREHVIQAIEQMRAF